MSNEGYAAKAGQAVINLQKIFGDKPDMAIDSLNTPENLDVLSGVFAPELQQRIGMPDSRGQNDKRGQDGSIVPAQQEGTTYLLALILTYSDGSTAHKPVTEYGSAHHLMIKPCWRYPLIRLSLQVRDFLFAANLQRYRKNYGYFMPKQQGLALKELQEGGQAT